MKKIILISLCLLSFIIISAAGPDPEKTKGDPVVVTYSPQAEDLVLAWKNEYQAANPEANISFLPEKPGNTQIASLSLKIGKSPVDNKWTMIAGRNALVPLLSPSNPFIKEIYLKGIKISALRSAGTENLTWDALAGTGKSDQVHLYLLKNDVKKDEVSNFLGENITCVPVENSDELLLRLKSDPYGIGFCDLTGLTLKNGKAFKPDVVLLPIDRNGNGKLDYFENIYSDTDHFTHGIWTGKFPGELCTSVYFTSGSQPSDKERLDFLKWVLGNGQNYLNANGLIELGFNERIAKAQMLDKEFYLASANEKTFPVIWVIIAVVVLSAGLIITIALRRAPVAETAARGGFGVMNAKTVNIPRGVFFDRSHTWAFMEKDGLVRIGVDDFLQKVTGPLTRIGLKNEGEKIAKGEKIFTVIQDGKQLSILSPVSGTIRTSNARLAHEPYLVNDKPFSDGWVYLIEPTNWLRETSFMFMSEKYSEWLVSEFSRVRDFFAVSLPQHEKEYAHVVLQDGGELRENVLKEFGPEIWEDFQTKFIETSF